MRWYEGILLVALALWAYDRLRAPRGGGGETDRYDPSEFAAGRGEAMLGVLERAVATAPRNAGLHAGRGRALCEVGRHGEALEAFKVARGLDPRIALHDGEGRALLGLGRHEEALRALEHAVGVDPGDATARADMGRALRKLGRHGEALEALRRAAADGADGAEIRYLIGCSMLNLAEERPQERQELGRGALEELQRARALDRGLAGVAGAMRRAQRLARGAPAAAGRPRRTVT